MSFYTYAVCRIQCFYILPYCHWLLSSKCQTIRQNDLQGSLPLASITVVMAIAIAMGHGHHHHHHHHHHHQNHQHQQRLSSYIVFFYPGCKFLYRIRGVDTQKAFDSVEPVCTPTVLQNQGPWAGKHPKTTHFGHFWTVS